MKLIIAGSRDLDPRLVYVAIDAEIRSNRFPFAMTDIIEGVSGTARGVDKVGEQWFEDHGISVKQFPANWSEHGLSAGLIRNAEMAQYSDVLLAVTCGSRGTANMIDQMVKLHKPVYVVTMEKP